MARWPPTRRTAEREAGVVLVTVTLSLVALIAAAALAIDLGMGFVERRAARNAADHAVLAAAWADCHAKDPVAAANASVVRNGYPEDELTLASDGSTWTSQIKTTSQTRFARLIGFDTVAVSGRAVATCTGGGGSRLAIFAFGDTCTTRIGKIQLDFSGSNNTVYGGVHSNLNTYISGQSNDFGYFNPPVDPFTYVTTLGDQAKINEQWFDWPDYPGQAKKRPAPDWIHIEDYQPGGRAAAEAGLNYFSFTSDIDSSVITKDGLYYTTGSIDFSRSAVDLEVTLVAEGSVKISGSNQTMNPYVDGLLAMGAVPFTGLEQCDKFVVAMSGSNNDWSGIVYAPFGLVEFDGSSNTGLRGSLLGYTIRINGSNVKIDSDPSLFPPGPAPRLLE